MDKTLGVRLCWPILKAEPFEYGKSLVDVGSSMETLPARLNNKQTVLVPAKQTNAINTEPGSDRLNSHLLSPQRPMRRP